MPPQNYICRNLSAVIAIMFALQGCATNPHQVKQESPPYFTKEFNGDYLSVSTCLIKKLDEWGWGFNNIRQMKNESEVTVNATAGHTVFVYKVENIGRNNLLSLWRTYSPLSVVGMEDAAKKAQAIATSCTDDQLN